jgi:type I restriction enzyme, S subunit
VTEHAPSLPGGWSLAPTNDLFSFVTSGSRGWAKYYADAGALFLRIGNLDHDTITLDLAKLQHVKPPGGAEGRRTQVEAGDVLVSITAELGMIGLIPAGLGEAYVNQHIALARPAPGLVPPFLAWFLASRADGNKQLLDLRRGATKVGLGLNDIRSVQVPFPPLNEQRRIVAKIEALTARSRRAREALEQIPTLLERFRQSVLASAFQGDLTAEWREQNPDVEPASVLLERIRAERRRRWEEDYLVKQRAKGKEPKNDKWKEKYKEPESVDTSELGELPKGWCWASIDEVVWDGRTGLVRSARQQSDTEGMPYVRMNHYDLAGEWGFDKLTRVTVTQAEREQYELRPGDVLFNTRNSYELVGKVGLWPESLRGYVYNNNLRRLRTVASVQPSWLASQMQSPRFRARLHELKSATTSVCAIYTGDLMKQPVRVPPRSEQQRIATLLAQATIGLRAAHSATEEGLWQSSRLDHSILAKAFRGELVPQDPNDEPASVLLERIRAEREAAAPAKKKRGRKKKAKTKGS